MREQMPERRQTRTWSPRAPGSRRRAAAPPPRWPRRSPGSTGRERLGGGREHLAGDVEVAHVVRLVLARQVDHERERRRLRIVVQRPEALGEDPVGVDAGPPGVERVHRQQPGVERGLDPGGRLLRDRRERHAEVGRHVDEQRALAARVVDRRDPRAGRHPPRAGEQLHRVGHLVERRDAEHAVRVEQRLVRAVLARERAGVRGDHGFDALRAPDLQRDDRDVAFGRMRERGAERPRTSHGLDEERDHARRWQRERVLHVVGDVGDELLAGRDEQVEPDPPIVERERGERGSRVADERHRAPTEMVRRREPGRAEIGLEVEEPHAVAAAEGDPRVTRDRRDPLGERGCAGAAAPLRGATRRSRPNARRPPTASRSACSTR